MPTLIQNYIKEEVENYNETFKRAILRVSDNSPAGQYLAEKGEEFLIKSLLTLHDRILEEVKGKIMEGFDKAGGLGGRKHLEEIIIQSLTQMK